MDGTGRCPTLRHITCSSSNAKNKDIPAEKCDCRRELRERVTSAGLLQKKTQSRAMFRAFSFPMSVDRSRNKERLEATLAGLCELELLRQRQEYLVLNALQFGDHNPGQQWGESAPAAPPLGPVSRAQEDLTLRRQLNSLKGSPWALMTALEQQVGELRVDTETAYAEPPSDVGDSRPSSGFYELSEGPSPVGLSDSSVFREFQASYSRGGGVAEARVNYASERPKSVGDLFVANREGLLDSGPRSMVPRSFSAPYPRSLEGISEGTVAEEDHWPWESPYLGGFEEEQLYPGEQLTPEDIQQAHRVETYILGLIQRRVLPLRPSKPRTSFNSDPHKGLARQNSLCRRPPEPVYPQGGHSAVSPSFEVPMWGCRSLDEDDYVGMPLNSEESLSLLYSRPKPAPLAAVRPASLDYPCSAALEPTSSEPESPEHYQGYPVPRSPPSDDQMVSAQYIPAQQPCRAQQSGRNPSQRPPGKSGKSRVEVPRYSPERCHPRPKGTPKKCRFTEEKQAPRKPGRKACRSQSENSLLGQRVALERKYNTVDRDGGARGCQSRPRRQQAGTTGYRKWRSTLEISQDEGEILPGNQAPRRFRKPRQPPQYPYNHPHPDVDFQERAPICRPEDGYPAPCLGDSESSLSEADSPGSSSLSSDSDESGGLVWPQQLPPQLVGTPSPTSPPCGPPPKAFVKIKASHALKKKILRFRTGSLKVMTTV
ncbi:dapper homolog 3 [Amia ocellicauda]|uniref:dapper homolog 3 n=1 Tax=Amia ocellicauda TaxID=2972642 RepID=UPI00346488E1